MYQRQLDVIMEQIEKDGSRPSLLLHVCCAPCSSYVLEYLMPHFDITIDYYNPNIDPAAEHEMRLTELRRLVKSLPGAEGIAILAADYDHKTFLEAAEGFQSEPSNCVCGKLPSEPLREDSIIIRRR